MSPPDATIALLSGSGEINNVFSVPPFQFQQLEKPGVRTILNSFDIMDGAAHLHGGVDHGALPRQESRRSTRR